MKLTFSLLMLLTSMNAYAAAPIACKDVHAGQDIEVEYGTEPLYNLDSAKGFASLWGGKVAYDETTITNPIALKRFDSQPGHPIQAHVVRNGFLTYDNAGGLDYVSCNIVVKIGDTNVLVRKMRYGNDKKKLEGFVATLTNINLIEPATPTPTMHSRPNDIADLSFNGAAR